MKIKTAKGTEFECEAITSIPVPPRLYLHLVNTSIEEATAVFNEELPVEGYPTFMAVQSISSEGSARIKVSLRGD